MSSKKIAVEYIKLIEDYFNPLFKLGPNEIDHISLGEEFSNYRSLSNLISSSLDDLGKDIKSFWEANNNELQQELKNSDGMKCIYSGDISPHNALKLTKKTAMYMDSVLIPDPLYKISVQLSELKRDKPEYLSRIIRHAANMYKLRDLITADTAYPIVCVAPLGLDHISPEKKKEIVQSGIENLTRYGSKIFDKDFSTFDNLYDYLSKINTIEGLTTEISKWDQLPPDIRDTASLNELVSGFSKLGKTMQRQNKETYGQSFIIYLNSQLIRVEEHKYLCNELGASPIYDFHRPWFFMNRDLNAPNIDSAIAQGLQDTKLEWLGNIPPEAIKVLREENELEDFRQLLRKGLHDVKVKNDPNLNRTVDTLQQNLKSCIEFHNSKIDDIQKKVNRIANYDIPITTIGALVGWIPVVGNFLSMPFTIKDWFSQSNEVEAATKELAKSEAGFINFLIQAKDDRK
tara:strand:- start:11460 stop:12836 length:1377 start_codon:yes stop_codon:yes gene_type:complete